MVPYISAVNFTFPNDPYDGVVLANATSGNLAITLPNAIQFPGRILAVKKTDNSVNTVTAAGIGGQTIEGAASVVLSTQYQTVIIISNGQNWFKIAQI